MDSSKPPKSMTSPMRHAPVHSNKRSRAMESDEFALDNYHFNKRYLTEVMASSLNSLRVGDSSAARPSTPSPHRNSEYPNSSSPTVNPFSETPNDVSFTSTRSASPFYSMGDDHSALDSFMSDDSEDNDSWRVSTSNENASQVSSSFNAYPKSPGSPPPPPSPMPPPAFKFLPPSPTHNSYISPQSGGGASAKHSHPVALEISSLSPRSCAVPSPPSKSFYSETYESRLPPSPSDHCHSLNLRRAAILRTAQLRRQASPRVSPLVSPLRDDSSTEESSRLGPHSLAPEDS